MRAWISLSLAAAVVAIAGACGESKERTQIGPAASPLSESIVAETPAPIDDGGEVEPTSEPLGLPDLLTGAGSFAVTGGEFVDSDGYRARLDLTVYSPVALDVADPADLDLCPDQTTGSDGLPRSQFSEDVAEDGNQTEGGVAVAFRVAISSPDPQFPYPIQQLLQEATEDEFKTSQPYIDLQGIESGGGLELFEPGQRSGQTCLVNEDDQSAEWIGFSAVLPSATATPDNPDRRISVDYPFGKNATFELLVVEPLYDFGGWRSYPHTRYGPLSGGIGSTGWSFHPRIADLEDRFQIDEN